MLADSLANLDYLIEMDVLIAINTLKAAENILNGGEKKDRAKNFDNL
jgi:hypothetical protein